MQTSFYDDFCLHNKPGLFQMLCEVLKTKICNCESYGTTTNNLFIWQTKLIMLFQTVFLHFYIQLFAIQIKQSQKVFSGSSLADLSRLISSSCIVLECAKSWIRCLFWLVASDLCLKISSPEWGSVILLKGWRKNPRTRSCRRRDDDGHCFGWS